MMSRTITHKRKVSAAVSDSQRSDEELLLDYRDHGDRRAFAALVRRYERELYSYLCRYLGDAAMAEDVFQATFLNVHLKCRQFEADRRVRPWLFTIATNQAIDAQRRNRRHRMVSLDKYNGESGTDDLGSLLELLESSESSPIEQVEDAERRRWVREAITRLAEPLRAAVNLIYFHGMKYREAAEVLDVPVGTVKSRMHTAVLKLNEAWKRTHALGDE